MRPLHRTTIWLSLIFRETERRIPRVSGTERPACQAAIIQALRFHFRLRPKEIAQLLKIESQRVSMATGESLTILSWEAREYKNDAILAAQKLLQLVN